MNRITGITVCVNYADLLQRGIERWQYGLERLVVVTDKSDDRTHELCRRHGAELHVTESFYDRGAAFNKGAALNEAIRVRHLAGADEWLLTFDSDIVPPAGWRRELEALQPSAGKLYGSYRWQVDENAAELAIAPGQPRMPQGWVIGFFMLFHLQDSAVRDPIFDPDFPHAGSYDTVFCQQWPKERQVITPLRMLHLGEERRNWFGRGKTELMDRMTANRRAGHAWEFERIKP